VGRTVLIVDDDKGFHSVAQEIFEQHGYEVVGHAAGAAEARTRASELDPDVVLLDVGLPDGNGVVLAGELMRASVGRPTMLLTSANPQAVPEHVLTRTAACGFIAKTDLANTDLDRYLQH
jgi:two-component system nitrate/nitrite response regulator NarL